MSMDYWGITGYGVCLDDIEKYLDREKVNKIIRQMFPDEEFTEDVFDGFMFCGDPYTNFAEFLCEFDDRKILTYDDDGQGVAYFLYVPPYPWKAKENEPKTRKELEDYMISILRRVYDTDDCDLRNSLDYISTWGAG